MSGPSSTGSRPTLARARSSSTTSTARTSPTPMWDMSTSNLPQRATRRCSSRILSTSTSYSPSRRRRSSGWIAPRPRAARERSPPPSRQSSRRLTPLGRPPPTCMWRAACTTKANTEDKAPPRTACRSRPAHIGSSPRTAPRTPSSRARPTARIRTADAVRRPCDASTPGTFLPCSRASR